MEAGSALLEYAIAFVFITVVVWGMMDFSRALYAYHFVDHAAKSAARWAAVNGSACGNDGSCNGTGGMNSGPASALDISNYVAAHVPAGIDPNQITTTVCWPTATGAGCTGPPACTSQTPPTPFGCAPAVCFTSGGYNSPGCPVQVNISYNFSFLFPSIVDIFHFGAAPASIALSSTSEMVIAH